MPTPAVRRWLAHLVASDGGRLTFDGTGPELAVDFTAPTDRLARVRRRLALTLLGFDLLAHRLDAELADPPRRRAQ
jgi:hypothetical protein